MAEIQDDKERKKLYGLLVSDPATRKNTAQYSFKQWESKLLGDEENIKRVADYAVKKNWSYDQDDFFRKYAPEKIAKPQPQVQAAPAMQMAAPVEEETYTPPPQPLIGSSKYNNRVRELNPFPTPTLGETFGGVPAVFETREQRRQEEMSPVFKAHNLAFVDNPFSPNPYNAPVAEEQRKAQRQFNKATKQEKEAALRGGTGFELQQKQANERRDATKKLKDFGSSLGVTFDNMINKVKAAEAMFGAKQRSLLTFGEKGKKAEEQEKKIKQQVLGYLDQVDQDFATKQAEYNIEGNIYDVISKGQLDRLPEAFAYNLAQIGINALGAGTTGGYSTFAQVVPDMYKAGVEEIARKTNTTPEEVIASGKDKEVIAYTAGVVSGGIDYYSSGLLGKAMKSKGAYKFLRDLALDKIGKTKWKQAAASAAALGGVANIEGLTEGAQGLIEVAAPQIASAKSFEEARQNIYGELQKPSTQRRLASDIVGGAAGGGGLVAGGRGLERVLQGDFTYGDVRKTTQRADMDIVQTDNKIQERNKIAQAMEEAVKGNPEAEGQIRQQYQKRVNEAAPTDEEVLNAYEGLAALPETEEKNTIRENLEAYMAEKGIQPEAAGMDAGLGEGMRVTAPSEEASVIQTVNPQFPPPQPPAPTEEAPLEEVPAEEAIQEDEDLASLGQTISGLEQAPVEEVAPEVAPEQVVPAEEETPVEEVAPQPKAGDFVIVNGEKGVVVVTPGGQMSVETDTKIYDLDERGIAGIGGKLVAPKEQTQTEYEVEVIDDDNAIVNGESFKIIRDEKGNTIALQGETRTIRTEPVMVDVDIKRNKAQVKETLQEQSAEVETLSPDMTLDKQGFVDDIIGQNMTEGVDRILSEGVTDKTAERDLLQFKLFVEATIADLRSRQKGNPYAEAMIEQLQEALNTVYYEYYSQGRKAEARTAKPQKKTDRGVKGKERVSPKPAEGKQPAAPVKPAPATPKKEEAPKPEPKKEGAKKEVPFKGIVSFETAKGSVYTVLPNGKTQRFKTATKEQNEPQDLTVFVKFKNPAQEQDFLEGVQRSETSGTKVYVIDKQGNKYDTNEQAAGKDVRLALVKDGKVIDTAETSTTPKIGYNAFDQRRFEKDGEKYREAHLGNKVVKINEQAAPKKEETPKPEAKEAKPTTGTPQEGDAVEIAPQREGGSPRKMVFKDGEWKQNVGGDIVKVGPSVQQQAQEMFGGKAETKPAEKEGGAKESLGKRLKGDALLNAEDTLAELSDNGATINPDGTVVVYHRTTKDKADAIVKNNEMFGLEDGVFFSTSEKGQAEGYGDVVVKMNVPIEQIQIDDTFGNEAHVRIPTKKANQKISVGKFSPQVSSAETKSEKILEELGKRQVPEGKGDWRARFNKEVDPFKKTDILRAIADSSTNTNELNDIKEAAKGMPDEGNIVAVVDKKLAQKTEAQFTSKQESSASQEFDGMKKPSKIKTKSFDGKHGKGAFERMKNITDNFEDIMDGMSGKIKQDCL